MRRVLLGALCLTSLVLLALVTVAGTPGTEASRPLQPSTTTEQEPDRVNQGADEVETATAPVTVAVAASVPPLPACMVADEPATASRYDEWHMTILDTRHALSASYEPPDLVPLAAAFPVTTTAAATGRLRALLIDDLRDMVSDAAAAGHRLAVQSAYRDYAYQADTFQYWVDHQGLDRALATSARAGHSEHQLGTALDLRSFDGPAAWDLDDWATTAEGAWVAAHAWRYGFVMSYPPGMQDTSCYAYEPWHYRYFGRELAASIQASGLTAREALWTLAHGGSL